MPPGAITASSSSASRNVSLWLKEAPGAITASSSSVSSCLGEALQFVVGQTFQVLGRELESRDCFGPVFICATHCARFSSPVQSGQTEFKSCSCSNVKFRNPQKWGL